MSKVKVLVVDDEIEFATTLAERLNIRGFETTACFCTEDALALIHAKNIPDVVLLDFMLTGHGGGIPLVGADRKKFSPFDCIMKPADIHELTLKINQAMAKRQASLNKGEGT
jgi:DNA-binding response OmpR family regulator